MPEVHPFTGLLYDPAMAGPMDALTAPPYDVIMPVDRDRYYRASPYNVVRLILGKDEPDDAASANKYTRAASYLSEWLSAGVLVPTAGPALFPYQMEFHLGGASRRVRGLLGEVALEPFGGSIVPHERTMPGPIEDRLRLLRAVGANLSPVYAVFPGAEGSGAITDFIDQAAHGPPAREVVDEAGTRHRLWVSPGEAGPDGIQTGPLMIADGHHRYRVALAYREEMRSRVGEGPWDSMLMLVVDASREDPPVLPIHRLARTASFPGLRRERVRDLAEILASLKDEDLSYGSVRVEDGEVVHRVGTLPGTPPTVSALHEQILDRHPGLDLRFVPDAFAAEAAVREGSASEAFLLPPTTVDRVWTVVGAGRMLPQKSTYFWPKPRTGMVIRSLGP